MLVRTSSKGVTQCWVGVVCTVVDGPRILIGPEYKEKKKLQIGIHIVLKNIKYTKSLFLNTLKCNYLRIKTKTKTK